MFNSFIISFKLRNTYRVNSIIYSIKQLPLIKKILPNSLYKNKGLKILGNILSILMEICNIFLGKFIYILAMIVAMLGIAKTSKPDAFIHIFTFLTMIGALLNTYMFNPTKDKYYAMVLMNMDAKKYTLSNYYYAMIKLLIGFIPFTLLFGIMSGLSPLTCVIMPIYAIILKTLFNTYLLWDYKKTGKVRNENLPTKILWTLVGIFLILAYGLPILGITINQTIFLIIFLITLIFGIFSFKYVIKFDEYKRMYKALLTQSNVYVIQNQKSSQVMQDTSLKQIELDIKDTSNKNGFAYFHDLFVKRHKKILTKSAKKTAIITLFIFIAIILAIQLYPEMRTKINDFTLRYLPYFVFIMYIINRGTVVTQAMFMNCDHSMLTYRFYKTPKVILSLFKERLKTLIQINLLPAIVIAIGLPLILYLTGGTDNPLNYAILFISIIAMSIFFSVHYLILYYLLQPYNVNIEMKSSTYTIAQTITYFVCYAMLQIKMPTYIFGISTIIFSIIYCIISLILVYKYAPKTFKLRI